MYNNNIEICINTDKTFTLRVSVDIESDDKEKKSKDKDMCCYDSNTKTFTFTAKDIAEVLSTVEKYLPLLKSYNEEDFKKLKETKFKEFIK